MNFFQKIGNSLARFMYGRNGVDQLGFVTLWAAIILDVVNLFVRNQVAYSILSAVAMVLTIWMVFRMFSKNLSKRRAENAAYMNKVVYPLRQALSRSRDKEHKYFTCPNCRTVCRVPRGKGRIVITCPKCGAEFTAKADSKKISTPGAGHPRREFFLLCRLSDPLHPAGPPAASHRRPVCSRHRRRARPHSRR